MLKTSHRPKAFTANREFTDREDAKALFRHAFNDPQSVETYRVLNWYGVGGEGKSALTRKLIEIADEIAQQKDSPKIARARIDLEDNRLRRVDNALLSIRLQLARAVGANFPCFDTAFARYFTLTNPGINIRDRHPELFKGENALLDELIDASEDGISSIAEVVSNFVPGLNLLYRYCTRLSQRAKEWFQRRGKLVLKGLDDLTPDQLLLRLPSYLGADLFDLLSRKEAMNLRLLIVVDTHEALWRDFNIKDPVDGAKADAWLRSLVQEAPGVLVAILGRNKLCWMEIDSDWGEVIESHRLGALSDEDADHFLRQVPIDESEVRKRIVQSAQGLPFYLDLQVSLYEHLKDDQVSPNPELFGDSQPEILRRFFDHLTENELKTVRLASYSVELTESEMNALATEFMGGIGMLDWAWLSKQSFITDNTGNRLMHNLMRDALQTREEEQKPEAFRAVHHFLFNHYASIAQIEKPSQINQQSRAALARAVWHRRHFKKEGFFNWFWSAVKIYRLVPPYGFLENLFRELLAFYSQELSYENFDYQALRHNLAWQIGCQGRYAEAEAEFRAVWEIQHRPEVLGEDHPHTLTTRYNLAQQIGNQGHYAEAETEFRAVWEIRRRPEVLGEDHPHTLNARNDLAKQIGNQGRYAEAEAEFRAVWEIRRRPEVMGKYHPETLTTRQNLALQIGNQGRYAEAEAEFRAVWEIRRRPEVMGKHHPETLTTRQNLALQIGNQGRYAEAETEFRAVLEILRRPEVLGEDHPDTLITRQNLAQQIGNQGRHAEAEAEFRAVWEIQHRPEVLGEDHPNTLITRQNLAQQIGNQGRHAEAETEFRAVWEILRRPEVLGEDHPNTLITRQNLALQIGNQGRYAEAEAEFRAVWEILRRPEVLGKDHPNTLRTQFWLVKMLDCQEQYPEADKLLIGLEAKLLQHFPQTHPWVADLREYMAKRGSDGS